MKVMHVLGKSFGGIRQHVAALDSELKKRDIDSFIVGPVGVMGGLATQEGQFDRPKLKAPWTILLAVKYLRRKSKNCDVIHAHGVTAAYLSYFSQLFIKSRKPIVLTLHNVANTTLAGRLHFLSFFFQSFIISRASHIVCPSNFAKQQLTDDQQEKLNISIVLPVGKVFTAEQRQNAISKIESTREKYSFGPKDKVLVCIARFNPQKDFRTLIDAFVFARANDPDLRLVIAGSGTRTQTAELELMIDKSGVKDSINLVGYVESPEELIAASQVMVLSSIYETVPLVLLESLQFGVPVIMTDTGIAREILRGECGAYFPVGNALNMAELIQTWSTKVDSNTIDSSSLQKIADSWLDPEKCVIPLIKIYSSI